MSLRVGSTLGAVAILVLAGCGGGDSDGGGGGFSQQVQQAQKISNPATRAAKLINIASQQRQAKDQLGAEQTLGLAQVACEAVKDPADKATRFAWLSMTYSYCENPSGATRALRASKSALAKVPLDRVSDYGKKIKAATQLAQAQFRAGEGGRATSTLNDARSLALQMKGEGEKDALLRAQVEGLMTVASMFKTIEKEAAGREIVDEALKLAEAIGNARDKSDTIAAVASMQSALKMEQADATFGLAEEAAGQIEDVHLQGHALVVIAEKRLRAGHKDQAIVLLNQAEKLAKEVTDNAFRKELEQKIRETRP